MVTKKKGTETPKITRGQRDDPEIFLDIEIFIWEGFGYDE